MEDKITIIEGPTPQFIHIEEDWTKGIEEGPVRYGLSLTNVRTFNGNGLVERCHRTWREKGMMYLEYRDTMGMTMQAPILAARAMETPDGQVLQLWLRMEETEEIESNADDEG